MLIVPIAIPVAIVLMGDVVADGAACDGAQNGMVVQQMTGDAADDGALDAPLRFRRRSGRDAERGNHGKSEDEFLHGGHSQCADGR